MAVSHLDLPTQRLRQRGIGGGKTLYPSAIGTGKLLKKWLPIAMQVIGSVLGEETAQRVARAYQQPSDWDIRRSLRAVG